jgi:hypothetical protein
MIDLFKALFHNFPGGTEERHENRLCPDRGSNLEHTSYRLIQCRRFTDVILTTYEPRCMDPGFNGR